MQPQQPENPLVEIASAAASALLEQLSLKEPKTIDKYLYYNADHDTRDFGISVPKKMMNNRPGVGWASRAVNTLGDRVIFDGFANDKFGINDYFDSIKAGSVINQTKQDALIAGCAFVAVADDPNSDRKVLIPFTAMEATGVVDANTGLLKYGLAVTRYQLPRDKRFKQISTPHDYILFTPEYTAIYKDKVLYDIVKNPTGRTLLHPITHRASADRPLGKSRLTNTARRIINEVGRVKRRYEIASEFYSTPQRYIVGLSQGAKKDPSLDSALGKVWAITKDDNDESPSVGQLQQMSIEQFSGQKKDLARDFCAETALTLRNLGYETGNPTSAESLSAMSDDLLLEAESCQTEMGEQIKQIAITLRMAIDGVSVAQDGLKNLIPSWKPIFQLDLGSAGDAVFKLFQAMPELAGSVTAYRMLGVGIREAERLAGVRASAQSRTFMQGGA